VNRVNLLAGTLIIILATAIVAIASAALETPEARSASVLIENAERLQAFVYCRNEIIESGVNVTLLGDLWTQILNYTAEGDYYLELSKEFYANGNYTAAKIDAIWAIRYYGQTIALQAQVVGKYNITYAECSNKILNMTRIHQQTGLMNHTGYHNKTTVILVRLSTKISILEQRIAVIKNLLLNLNLTEEEVIEINNLLSQAESLLSQAKSLLNSSLTNATYVEVNKLIVQTQKILGNINRYVAKIGLKVTINRAIKLGIQLNISKSELKHMSHNKAFEIIKDKVNKHAGHGPGRGHEHGVAGPPTAGNETSPVPPPVEPPYGRGHGKKH